ncbi:MULTISPECIES: hypothetical protein [Mycolicibacterium]|uniref:Lysin A peptidase domain n=1 Tax=Mycobacterium phage Bipper TaxID=1805457 RepID=A0A142F2G3_9CAUD|nr:MULTISPECIES: hypothetical protein [Mycolicibacterium]YP_009303182.1 lysin A peptidase domain [Mycobacterium phage Bipper]QDF19321.1 hypothetical protein SEA_CRACKLEWINK_34 [Mycobacterium phage Cracklewink]AMQ66970.1 lysin A peptidase domain [Mycobacterium phage Bipper]MCC9181062.1 hypothetical protein [Mycolicibacterium mageritense]UBV14782.1 hypothetical protein H8Z57_29475 [Mycolicibacterium fortuitum]
MASPDDVQNYLRGQGWSRWLYEGSNDVLEKYKRAVGDVRELVGELAWNLLRHHDQYDIGRPGAPQPGDVQTKRTYGLFDSVKRTVFELTLWLPQVGRKELLAKRSGKETVLGHAVAAASAASLALEVALKVADKVGADLSDIEGLDR